MGGVEQRRRAEARWRGNYCHGTHVFIVAFRNPYPTAVGGRARRGGRWRIVFHFAIPGGMTMLCRFPVDARTQVVSALVLGGKRADRRRRRGMPSPGGWAPHLPASG